MRLRTTALAFALALLVACGGGGGGGGGSTGGGGTAATATTISGTVAANTPLAGYDVDVVASAGPSGAQGAHVTTGSDGRYSARVEGLLASQRVTLIRAGRAVQLAEPQYPRLHSLPKGDGNSNVTPLTSLLVARLLNRKPKGSPLDFRAIQELENRSDAGVSAAQQQVVDYLLNNRPRKDNGNFTSPVDVQAVTDFISMPVNPAAPGDPHFEALKRFHESLMDSETIEGVEEHMLFRNDSAVDLAAMLSLDFVANCTANDADTRLPRGTTRVILDRQGVTFGTAFQYLFEAGGQMSIIAGQSRDNLWEFRFFGKPESVIFGVANDGRLAGVSLSLDFPKSASCTASGELSLTGKHPSLMALVRRFAGAAAPNFQCAGPITDTRFQMGTNSLTFDANGAARVNALTGGPSLHLPSLDISLAAIFVSTGTELEPRPRGLTANRILRGGFDTFRVDLDGTGQIIGLALGRQNEQVSQSQSCGI